MISTRIFDRLPGETDKPYRAFQIYLGLPAGARSTARVAKQFGRTPRLVERWASQNRWVERASAYEDFMVAAEHENTAALAREKGVIWIKRQQAIRETEWDIHERAIEVGRRVLKFWKDRPEARASLADLSRLLEMASKLGRLASGLATDHVEEDVAVNFGLKPEFDAALLKIYGDPLPGDFLEAEILPPSSPATLTDAAQATPTPPAASGVPGGQPGEEGGGA